MNLATIGSALALLTAATQASAQTWIQYNFSGVGNFYAEDTWDGTSTSGSAGLSGSFTVEIEPGLDDYWTSTGFRFDNYPNAGPEHWVATANTDTLFLSFTDGCEFQCTVWNVTLHYTAGTFSAGFPTNLPAHPLSSIVSYHAGTDDFYEDASGSILNASATAVSGIRSPVFHIAEAVPEPASWLMMVGGFGLVGGALRTRRRAVVSFA